MKNSFLFKRGKYFHLEYFDEFECRIKRISTKRTTKSKAIKFLTEYSEKQKAKALLTPKSLYDFLTEYEDFVKQNLSRKYSNNVKSTFKELKGHTENIPLRTLTSKVLEEFISIAFKRSKYSAKQNYNNLRSAFNKAISWGYIETNPFNKISIPKIPYNNPRFLNDSEFRLILSNEPNELFKDIYLFAFHTGMRLSEIVNVTWNQISLTDRIIRVSNTKEFITKGKKERIIPINGTLFNMLQNRLPKIISIQKIDLLFAMNGFKFKGDYISRKFKKAVKESGINPDIHFHDLRHSFASNMVKKGVSIFIVKELLGHQDVRTTQVYSHLTVESLKDAVKVLES